MATPATLWVISHLDTSPGTTILLEHAASYGFSAELVHPERLHIVWGWGFNSPQILGADGPRTLPDVVFTRMGSSSPSQSLSLMRHLEDQKVPCVNSSLAIEQSQNKIRSLQCLGDHGIPLPKTALASKLTPIESLLDFIPGPPWIIKFPTGVQGKGVILAESVKSLRSILDAVHALGTRAVVQEFIAEAAGSDVRVFVVNGEVVASMKRTATNDDFRSNLHRGAVGQPFTPSDEVKEVAIRAANAVGLKVAGVDILLANTGPVVLEVNASPGLAGISEVCGKAAINAVFTYLKEEASK